MVHLRGRLQGHLVVGDVGHEALCVAEVQVPSVEQGGEHEGAPGQGTC